MVVDEIRLQPGEMVDVIEAMSEVGRNLHSRHPGREDRVARVSRVSETIGEVRPGDEFVHEIDTISRYRRAEELD